MYSTDGSNYDPTTNPVDVYYQYSAEALQQQTVEILPVAGSANITTINGGGGGSVTGPTITLSGGTTGLTFIGAGTSITMSGTLAIANGGTGATTAALARTSLSVPRIHTALVAPAVGDDGAAGYPVGSLWVDTVLADGYISVDATAGAAVWKKVTP